MSAPGIPSRTESSTYVLPTVSNSLAIGRSRQFPEKLETMTEPREGPWHLKPERDAPDWPDRRWFWEFINKIGVNPGLDCYQCHTSCETLAFDVLDASFVLGIINLIIYKYNWRETE